MTCKENTNFCILVETCGKIVDILHQENNPFDIAIEKGMQLDQVLPIFHGYFPLTVESLSLENMSFENFSGNILLQTNRLETEICFFCKPEEMKQWKDIYQRHNQEKLINKMLTKSMDTMISNDVLNSLGFMGFKKNAQGFVLLGNIPNWFNKIFPDYNYSSNKFVLEDIFPFLEVFLPDVFDMFDTDIENKIYSGLWTEVSPGGEEVILQATAINNKSDKYIFIESVSERNPQKHADLQKSRELSLKHQQLLKTEEALRELLKSREQFISIFTHDIKSPLSGVYSLVDFLMEDENFTALLNEEYAELLGVIRRNLSTVFDYTNQLYDWSNLNFAKMDVTKTLTNLRQMFNDVLVGFSDKVHLKDIKMELDVPVDIMVNVDAVFFKNVIQNLINNALKFSYHKGLINIHVQEQEQFIQFSIADTGVGMDKTVMESIFKYDTKISTQGTDGEMGTGIGLNIVKRILDLHGATISVESEPQKGSTFIIQLQK
jgi:signal transduction histidine kinase